MRYRLLAKELRENCIWALIAFLVAMVVIFLRGAPDLLGPLGSHLLLRRFDYYSYYTRQLRFGENVIALPLLWPTGIMTMFCMLWGGALGFAQTLVERGRGTYGVLLALPVTRMQVFAAKVATGVLLYLVSVGVPNPMVADFEPERDASVYGHGATVRRYMRHLQECLDEDKEPSPNVADGAKSVAVGVAAWASIKTGKPVRVFNDF